MQIQIEDKDSLDNLFAFGLSFITKEIYDDLSKEDRLVVLMFLTTKDLNDAVIKARSKVGIPEDGWGDPRNTGSMYGHERIVNTTGDLKVLSKIERKLVNETRTILNRLNLDKRWENTIFELIRFGIFVPPQKYTLRHDLKYANPVIEINTIEKSPNDFIDWIRSVWPRITEAHPAWLAHNSVLSQENKPLKTPQFENLREYVFMLRLRKVYGLSYGEISQKILVDHGLEKDETSRRRVINTLKSLDKAIQNSKEIITKRTKLRKGMGGLL